jgi:hypothetical protein
MMKSSPSAHPVRTGLHMGMLEILALISRPPIDTEFAASGQILLVKARNSDYCLIAVPPNASGDASHEANGPSLLLSLSHLV